MTYLITFACYGRRLHGSELGSVDRKHNAPRTALVEPNASWVAAAKERMDQTEYEMDSLRREAVLEAIKEACSLRGWYLLAAHIRSPHAHIVVDAEAPPERVMNDFKAYASRRLNEMKLDEPNRKRWARHDSTRWLWKPKQVSAAIEYVVREQGEPMAVFESRE